MVFAHININIFEISVKYKFSRRFCCAKRVMTETLDLLTTSGLLIKTGSSKDDVELKTTE